MNTLHIALNRFGLGARPDESVPTELPDGLLAQLDRFEVLSPSWLDVPRSLELVQDWARQQRAVQQAPQGERSSIREAYLRSGRAQYVAAVGARARSALRSTTPFVERLVHFWANHFAVSVDKLLTVGVTGGFEADAIRPHVRGRFEDLLLAAVRHPAMLLYLDQARSSGPNSVAAQRIQSRRKQSRPGLNENLAREILELHTLGVRSGYTQEDVTELARALTGWTLPGDDAQDGSGTTFRYVPALHEPGARMLLGQSYVDDGEQQAQAMLRYLANAPATAHHIATKLARHFVADVPSEALVQRLANTFKRTGGDLPSLYRELVRAPEAWQGAQTKFKSPWDWAISGMRALGLRDVPSEQIASLMNQLGQPVWRPGSPAGFGDTDATWAAPDALMRRVEVAQRLAARVASRFDARSLAPLVLPGTLSETTARTIAAAESPTSALALLLVAPEFLRR